MQLERNKTGKQRAEDQPGHRRRVKYQYRHARRRIDVRALQLFHVPCGSGDGWFFQWNSSVVHGVLAAAAEGGAAGDGCAAGCDGGPAFAAAWEGELETAAPCG